MAMIMTNSDSRVLELASRIREGNLVLWRRWRYICKMNDLDKDRYIAGWDKALDRLLALCDELAASPGGGCAYSYDGAGSPKFSCLGCSVPPGRWAKDLVLVGSRGYS